MANEAPVVVGILVGLSEYKGAVRAAMKLTIGQGVILDREKNNPYDANAFRVLNSRGRMLGHIDAVSAAVLARWVDKGYIYLATVATPPQIKRFPNHFGVKKGSITIKCVPLPPLLKELQDDGYCFEYVNGVG